MQEKENRENNGNTCHPLRNVSQFLDKAGRLRPAFSECRLWKQEPWLSHGATSALQKRPGDLAKTDTISLRVYGQSLYKAGHVKQANIHNVKCRKKGFGEHLLETDVPSLAAILNEKVDCKGSVLTPSWRNHISFSIVLGGVVTNVSAISKYLGFLLTFVQRKSTVGMDGTM